MNSVLIIINPSSGDNSASEYGNQLREILDDKGIDTRLFKTSNKQKCGEIKEILKKYNYDTVAILGGDGTISNLVNEMAELEDRPEVLLLPLGTTNNLARALQIELDLDVLLEKIGAEEFTRKKIDIGRMNKQHFVSTLSAGSLPEIAWQAEDKLKEQFGSFAYVLEGLKVLNKDESFSLKIMTDDEVIVYEDIRLLVIGLTNSIFGIPIFFEEGEVDDGKLHLFALKSSNLLNEASAVARFVFWDDTAKDNELSYAAQFTKARIESSTELHLAVDGEKGSQFPIELEVLHNHLTFIVPEKN